MRRSKARSMVKVIQLATAGYYGIYIEDMLGDSRLSKFAVPRMVAMYLCRILTFHSYITIAEFFNRDHSTVINGYQRIKSLAEKRPLLQSEIRSIIRDIEFVVEVNDE